MSSIRIIVVLVSAIAVATVAAPTTNIAFASATNSIASPPTTSHPWLGKSGERIVNGSSAGIGQFPYQVSLRELPFKRHFCGGSIIASRWILTAAHCLANHATYELVAVVGTVQLSGSGGGGGVEYDISVKRSHSEYVANQRGHDIALLRTAKVIVFDELVQPIVLPAADTRAPVSAVISGWGRADASDIDLPDRLQFLGTTVISSESCRSQLPNVVADFDELICHRSAFGGACHGDSGKCGTRHSE